MSEIDDLRAEVAHLREQLQSVADQTTAGFRQVVEARQAWEQQFAELNARAIGALSDAVRSRPMVGMTNNLRVVHRDSNGDIASIEDVGPARAGLVG